MCFNPFFFLRTLTTNFQILFNKHLSDSMFLTQYTASCLKKTGKWRWINREAEPTVCQAFKVIFWPTPCLKGRSFDISWFSHRGTYISASAVAVCYPTAEALKLVNERESEREERENERYCTGSNKWKMIGTLQSLTSAYKLRPRQVIETRKHLPRHYV